MSGRAILFAGPSLWGSRRVLPSAIELRPPAACGDVLRAAADRPRAIGLIDGLFESGPSVWHKEILAAIAAGVPVFGAASLGALRAAELGGLGMIGIGTIHAAYRDGLLTRDDAVMVSHAPAALGHRPLTVALVDAAAAIEAGGGPPADKALLTQIAGRMNFRDRTWPAMRAAFASRAGRSAPSCDEAASLKRQDAEALIDALGSVLGVPEAALRIAKAAGLPETVFLRALRRRISR